MKVTILALFIHSFMLIWKNIVIHNNNRHP